MSSRWLFVPTAAAAETITWTLVLGTKGSNRFALSSYAEAGAGATDWREYPFNPIRTNSADTYIEFLVRLDTANGNYSTLGDFQTNATISDSRFLHGNTAMNHSSLTLVGNTGRNLVRFRFNDTDTSSFYDAFQVGDTLTIGLTYS